MKKGLLAWVLSMSVVLSCTNILICAEEPETSEQISEDDSANQTTEDSLNTDTEDVLMEDYESDIPNYSTEASGGESNPSEFFYTISGNTVTIDKYHGVSENIIIPSEIEGYPVTRISGYAFPSNNVITSVSLPESITSIGQYAFYNCSRLESINLPDGITDIGEYAFSECSSLKEISIPENLQTLNSHIFARCEELTILMFPAGVTKIDRDAFSDCVNLTDVALPESVVSLDYNVFAGCKNLTSITIPDSVTSINGSSFGGCNNLKTVYYFGDETAWNEISIDDVGNDPLKNADIIFNYHGTRHPLQLINAVDAGCETDGNIGYYWCSECNRCFQDESGKEELSMEDTLIPAMSHDWGEWLRTVEPTCTEKGEETRVCSRDAAHIETKEIDALGHDLIKTEFLSATCEETGNIEYWECSRCGKLFADEQGNEEITPEDTVLPAIGHNWDVGVITKNATTTETGVITFTCQNDSAHKKTEEIPKLPVSVSSLVLNYQTLSVQKGNSFQLKVTVKPADASDKTVTWKSSNQTIATVNNNGKVTAKAVGISTVTAASSNGKTASCKIVVPGWIKTGGKWKYLNLNGKYTSNCWQKISEKWYYFNKSAEMVTGWRAISGKWYYFNSSGAMTVGWQKVSGKWYYMSGSGAMVTGWAKISNVWYYMNSSGAMVTGWQKISGKWYYFKSSGAMVTGSYTINGKTYRFSSSGAWIE